MTDYHTSVSFLLSINISSLMCFRTSSLFLVFYISFYFTYMIIKTSKNCLNLFSDHYILHFISLLLT